MQLWQDAGDGKAQLQLERFSATVDTKHPSAGLQNVVADGQSLNGFHPLAADILRSGIEPAAASTVEHYVRVGDLIATYGNRPASELRTQIYWRATSHERQGALAAMELVVSVQTSLLDSCPQLTVESRLLASEALRLTDAQAGTFTSIVPPSSDADPDDLPDAPHCYLFRLPGRQYSYAEMLQPAEGQRSAWDGWLHDTDYRLQLRHDLFSERLEKGVILRARILGVLVDRRDDKQAVARHWTAFLNEELPLTT